MKQKIIPIASIGIGILAFILSAQYQRKQWADVQKERAKMQEGARKTAVVVTQRDVPALTRLEKEDLAKSEFPEAVVSDRAIRPEEVNLILGKKCLFTVPKGQMLQWSDMEGGSPFEKGLAGDIQQKMRAVSISVGGAAAVSGMIQPNDRVDVIGTFSFPSQTVRGEMETVTLTVLQDVTVLATGQVRAKQKGAARNLSASGYNTVTLEVTPREAEVLVFCQQTKGQLSLTLRSPSDVYYEADLPVINFEHIRTELPDLNEFRQKVIRRNPSPPKP